MKIIFSLGWLPRASSRKNFKQPGAELLFEEYLKRISQFVPCDVAGKIPADFEKNPGAKIWLCERSSPSKIISSEEISNHFEKLLGTGIKELWIVIGGADGFSKNEIAQLKPDFMWSFGALTLPHELAAVIASEQIYRAWTILRGLPYHAGH